MLSRLAVLFKPRSVRNTSIISRDKKSLRHLLLREDERSVSFYSNVIIGNLGAKQLVSLKLHTITGDLGVTKFINVGLSIRVLHMDPCHLGDLCRILSHLPDVRSLKATNLWYTKYDPIPIPRIKMVNVELINPSVSFDNVAQLLHSMPNLRALSIVARSMPQGDNQYIDGQKIFRIKQIHKRADKIKGVPGVGQVTSLSQVDLTKQYTVDDVRKWNIKERFEMYNGYEIFFYWSKSSRRYAHEKRTFRFSREREEMEPRFFQDR
ncbi:unnamed protein product [Didymodactylos carnosus]|uniref:Uncharacterized protein n=1 Tax=Didymodactylos carnosus TaxID=1234261 RepID=A0A814R219_9BILA|nr:unnamed protein product [Didymodactylos carnosus]CAF3890801.1 unnamed protein product [Didymodactylos carnosus]